MWEVRCPYCSSTHGRCAATSSGRSVTECCSCGRVIEERQTHTHPLFLLRAIDNPLPLVTPDLHPKILGTDTDAEAGDEDPFHPTGFITAFSTWSLESTPVFARSSSSFSGHLAELERALDCNSNSSSTDTSGPHVSVDNLRAYLQILDVASILGLDHDIADHAFELFKDCSSTTCLRNRSVEALATAALVQAIREAQEPRTLQEISTASNLPQKEIGKYIKILGEALKLSQPLNSNSISVHMPRFCTLLQLNKSAQELAAHIGEVVINKCFCTRRNPISISAAAIYLACQLEDKRKTQAEICKVTGLTEVTLRKVYKELLENWNDLLPPNYTPAVPPERAFPMTAITSGRSAAKVDLVDLFHSQRYQDKEKPAESIKQSKTTDLQEKDHLVVVKEEEEKKVNSHGRSPTKFDDRELNQTAFWQPNLLFGTSSSKADREKDQLGDQGSNLNETKCTTSESDYRVDRDLMIGNTDHLMGQAKVLSSAKRFSNQWQLTVPPAAPGSSYARFAKQQLGLEFTSVLQGIGNPSGSDEADGHSKKEKQ